MTFQEAFGLALTGVLIRRQRWHHKALLTAAMDGTLERVPEQKHWAGVYSPTLDDVEACDWTEVEAVRERVYPPDSCGAETDGHVCTRFPGHSGRHQCGQDFSWES